MTTIGFQAMELPIGQVVPSPINVRREVGDVSELTASIREQGILEPLVVRPTPDGNYEVIIGSRRLASAKEIGLPVVPVVVHQVSDADAIVRSLVENLQRGDLPLEDRVEAYKRLQDLEPNRFGSSQDLARALGRNRPSIVRDFDAYEALKMLRPRGIDVVHNAPPASVQRRSGEAIPESHAVLLEQAMSAVRGQLAEEVVEDTYLAMAQAIAPLERDRAIRLLDYFKMYPERSVSEIESMAFATVERAVTLPAETARQLEQLTGGEGSGNWGEAITRLIERSPVTTDDVATPVIETETLLPMLPESDPSVEGAAREDEPGVDRPGLPYRPLDLPEAPESVQRHNKAIWNLIHLPVKADFYTIGHSGKDIRQFVELLKAVGVSTLVDIRHTAASQYKPEFSKENLESELNKCGVEYVHKSKWGVPREIRALSVGQDSRAAIWDWYDENVIPAISNGEFSELRESAKPPLAFMCVEYDLNACHRHRLFLALEEIGLRGFDL